MRRLLHFSSVPQKLGQHFLFDLRWRRKIAEKLQPHAGDSWLEIGPGHGEMTESLISSGAEHVIAVETDHSLAAALRDNPNRPSNFEIVERDILETDLAHLWGNTAKKVRVYGSLPYYITSPILRRLFESASVISTIDVVIQEEVAERIVAKPSSRDYGYLSVLSQFYAKPQIVLRIPPGAFRPPPRVNSAMVQMTLPGENATLGITDPDAFLSFVQTCFAQKRKTLRNNLRGYPDETLSRAFVSSSISASSRAEQLTLPQFASLFLSLHPH
jgi:16S rRNA (adenine1518-N6/adenine1519-N6)-dimethyltransferase